MTTATARLEFRVSPQQKSEIERAAELSGESVSMFARTAAEEKADRLLREYEATTVFPPSFSTNSLLRLTLRRRRIPDFTMRQGDCAQL